VIDNADAGRTPPTAAVGWATALLGGDVVEVVGLRLGGMPWRVSVNTGHGVQSAILRTGLPDDDRERRRVSTEATALRLVNDHGVAAPMLLAADLAGEQAGQPALLISVCPGSSLIPRTSPPDRMSRFGAAAAQLHQIELEPTDLLPSRMRPIEIEDFTVGRADSVSAKLLDDAERMIGSVGLPAGRSVLLHGDLWHGNTLWQGDELTAIIDWDSAGVGHPGIDLASVRLDAAMMFGPAAADEVLSGYLTRAAELGFPAPSDLAYFDVVAALATPADMQGWVPNIAGQGRPDLTAEILVERRDAFLASALVALRQAQGPGWSQGGVRQ
jgi:aminoglycoside phosphotransferase